MEKKTAVELSELCRMVGLTKDSTSRLIDGSAAYRARTRADTAEHAARARATEIVGDFVVPDDYDNLYQQVADQRELLISATALWLCAAELVGCGGKGYDSSRGTTRMPWASGFGKGRAHASDGEAWNAAILDASGRLINEIRSAITDVVPKNTDVTMPDPYVSKHRDLEGFLLGIALTGAPSYDNIEEVQESKYGLVRKCSYWELAFLEKMMGRVLLIRFSPEVYGRTDDVGFLLENMTGGLCPTVNRNFFAPAFELVQERLLNEKKPEEYSPEDRW